jgi:hypothetical protein
LVQAFATFFKPEVLKFDYDLKKAWLGRKGRKGRGVGVGEEGEEDL